jgi:hypothetical protein
MDIVNTGLLKNPANWIVTGLMVFIAGIALHLIMTHYSVATNDGA